MVKLALLVLALPLVQEDPQVVYREGLFEEVDQGNLDKAIELYAKVLKSGAPDAVKAKALFRTGCCHDKKGKHKEAEQAWKDVIERFPEAAGAAKSARERLTRPQEAPPVSIDLQIQSSILELGAVSETERMLAIRKLSLIGETAVPELTRALQHRDRLLSLGAARVMIELERWDGLYDVYRRHFNNLPDMDASALGKLLRKHEPSRKRLLEDRKLYFDGPLIRSLAQVLLDFKDPPFTILVSDWLANPQNKDIYWDQTYSIWRGAAVDDDIAHFIDRLGESEPPELPKLQKVIGWLFNTGAPGPATRRSALRVLKLHPNPLKLVETEGPASYQLGAFLRVVDTEEFFNGPVAEWMTRPDDDFRRNLLKMLIHFSQNSQSYVDAAKARDRLWDLLVSPKIPMGVRGIAFEYQAPWGEGNTDRYMPQYLKLALDYLRANPPAAGKQNPTRQSAVRSLITYLPADSKDLPEALDSAFDGNVGPRQALIPEKRMGEIREPVVAAALRAIHRKAEGMSWALSLVDQYGNQEQQISLGALVVEWKDTGGPLQPLARIYIKGLLHSPKNKEGAAWGEFPARCEGASDNMKHYLAEALVGSDHPQADAFMKKAADSHLYSVRQSAIRHWRTREIRESGEQLIRALKDSTGFNQSAAIEALGHLRVLDAVPELIKYLEGSDVTLRDAASAALKLIREHYEERTKWQRWYDETKKALGK